MILDDANKEVLTEGVLDNLGADRKALCQRFNMKVDHSVPLIRLMKMNIADHCARMTEEAGEVEHGDAYAFFMDVLNRAEDSLGNLIDAFERFNRDILAIEHDQR